MLQVKCREDATDPSVIVKSSTGFLAYYVVLLAILGPIALVALLNTGDSLSALGIVFVGSAALIMFRQMNVYTEFRADSIRHRGVFTFCSIPTTVIPYMWFEGTGGSVFLVFPDRSATRFAVMDRSVGRDLAEKREHVAALLTTTLGAPYPDIAYATRPPGIRLARKDPHLRRFSSFARLLPSEWVVIAATVLTALMALIVFS